MVDSVYPLSAEHAGFPRERQPLHLEVRLFPLRRPDRETLPKRSPVTLSRWP